MKKIEASEIKDLTAYEKVREAVRASVIEHKKERRVPLGENITLLFENRETVLFQIQEMVRTERIVDAEKIEHDVDESAGDEQRAEGCDPPSCCNATRRLCLRRDHPPAIHDARPADKEESDGLAEAGKGGQASARVSSLLCRGPDHGRHLRPVSGGRAKFSPLPG